MSFNILKERGFSQDKQRGERLSHESRIEITGSDHIKCWNWPEGLSDLILLLIQMFMCAPRSGQL